MPKKYTLTEEQFIMLTSYSLRLRNNVCAEMRKAERDRDESPNPFAEMLTNHLQKEIDGINETFDSLNAKFKTNF
jgi:hypothetical protein